MALKIKEEYLSDIIRKIKENGFVVDGCACGDFVYKIDKDLFLHIYRSCRKSNNTPDDKFWEVGDTKFYKNIKLYYSTNNNDRTYVSEVEVDWDSEIRVRLDDKQKELIMNAAKEVTTNIYGREYR